MDADVAVGVGEPARVDACPGREGVADPVRELGRRRCAQGALDAGEIAGTRLRIGPIEAIDGTPVVDVKPVLVDSADG